MFAILLDYGFMRNAFIASILASIACGIMGTIIVEKKLVMMTGGIAHASFGGIGLGYLLGIEPIYAALVFSAGASTGIAALRRKAKTENDVLVSILWSLGMAIGIIFISMAPGYPPNIQSYLFGNILTVPNQALLVMLLLVLAIILFVASTFDYLKAYSFDEEYLSSMKVRTSLIEYLLFIMISFTVVLLIKVVGIILIVALLSAPPAIAGLFTYNLRRIMLFSILLGIVFCFTGLWISYVMDTASGASIIIVTAAAYLISVGLSKWKGRRTRKAKSGS